MRKNIFKVLAVVLCISVMIIGIGIDGSALTQSELQNNINSLEQQSAALEKQIKELQGKINAQQQLKKAIEQKIAVVQKQINLCNEEINKINAAIDENNKEIKAKEAEIELDKFKFKKRLRAIYMSNTGSDLQILLGADDFSEFLQLSQLTASVSARDKFLIEKLVSAIDDLNLKQDENNKLLNEQIDIKKVVDAKQKELLAENASIQKVINQIDSDQTALENSNATLEKQIKDYKNTLNAMLSGGGSFVYDGGDFLWPTPGFYNISAGFHSNDAVHKGTHYGVDIVGTYRGAIAGAKIIAIADGVVTKSNNSCTHNYGKNRSCGCGGGYGNYVTINHGTNGGKTYVATYGHMSSAIVTKGQIVKKGQVIGYVGTTGWSTGYHLHLGIAVNGVWKNPMSFYSKVG